MRSVREGPVISRERLVELRLLCIILFAVIVIFIIYFLIFATGQPPPLIAAAPPDPMCSSVSPPKPPSIAVKPSAWIVTVISDLGGSSLLGCSKRRRLSSPLLHSRACYALCRYPTHPIDQLSSLRRSLNSGGCSAAIAVGHHLRCSLASL